MATDPSDDNPVEFDWDRLVSWFAGLCRGEGASDCLPAALWLVCSSDPPVGPGSGTSPSELEALGELVSTLRDRFCCLVADQPVPEAIQSPGPLSWKTFAENLKQALCEEPDRFGVYLWLTIDFVRQFRQRFGLAEPAESEIRALLDYHDLYHPDLLPAVRRMTSSVPAGRAAVRRWQPSELSPQEKIFAKMLGFAAEVLVTAWKSSHGLGEGVSPWTRRFLRAVEDAPEGLQIVDLPIAALHRVDQIIDDPTLSTGGKWAAILEVLTLAAEGKVVSQ